MRLFSNIRSIVLDAIAFARNLCRSRSALAAENLFLRKQLTFFVERKQAPRRTNNATRLTMATLTRLFDWKEALVVVKPDTLVLWHRKGFRLFWRWKSRPKGRPTLPEELKKLIAEMAVANITWGEERIAHELLVKLGVRVSPRTVRKYIPIRDDGSPDRRNAPHRWATFVRNHAKVVVAADLFNVVLCQNSDSHDIPKRRPTALGPVANTDTKLRIYGLFQKSRVLAQDAVDIREPRPFHRTAEDGELLPKSDILKS